MRIVLSIVGAVALIIIITMGLKRNNGFFNNGYNLGELNYLTPAPAQAPAAEATATVAADTTKKAEEGTNAEAPKAEAGAADKSGEGGHK